MSEHEPPGEPLVTQPEKAGLGKAARTRKTCGCCLGAVVLPLFAAILVGVAVWLYSKPHADNARAYIESTVIPAVRPMELSALLLIASPALAADLNTSQGERLIESLHSRLGPLQSVDKSGENWNFQFFNLNQQYVYTAPATFEKSTGTLTLQLVGKKDNWQLNTFRVFSPALLP